jgi:hypothetical protein
MISETENDHKPMGSKERPALCITSAKFNQLYENILHQQFSEIVNQSQLVRREGFVDVKRIRWISSSSSALMFISLFEGMFSPVQEIEFYKNFSGKQIQGQQHMASFYGCVYHAHDYYLIFEDAPGSQFTFFTSIPYDKFYESFSALSAKKRIRFYSELVSVLDEYPKDTKQFRYYDSHPAYLVINTCDDLFSIKAISWTEVMNRRSDEFSNATADSPNHLKDSFIYFIKKMSYLGFQDDDPAEINKMFYILNIIFAFENSIIDRESYIDKIGMKSSDSYNTDVWLALFRDKKWIQARGMDVCTSDGKVKFSDVIESMAMMPKEITTNLKDIKARFEQLENGLEDNTPLVNYSNTLEPSQIIIEGIQENTIDSNL